MSQKIPLPLLRGTILSVPVQVAGPAAVPVPVFTPPDKDSDAPAIYEVHLYISAPKQGGVGAPAAISIVLFANEGAKPSVPVWAASTNSQVNLDPVVKILDGYPVRGDVTLALLAVATADAGTSLPLAVWGYYHRVGQGEIKQAERRPIGTPLGAFNAGVPFDLAPGASAVVHTFEPNRIDEMSLAFLRLGAEPVQADVIGLMFEDENNVLVTPSAIFLPRTPTVFNTLALPSTLPAALPPYGSLFPPGPYQIYQCPFGGGGFPTLDHLRVSNGSPDKRAIVHGYFTRR